MLCVSGMGLDFRCIKNMCADLFVGNIAAVNCIWSDFEKIFSM